MAASEKKPMFITIPATQVRRNFGDVIRRVFNDQEMVRVESNGLPVAWILSDAEMQRLRRVQALAEFEELSRSVGKELEAKGVTEEQALKDLEQVQRQVFEERYGKAPKTRRRKAS
jgi:prevent-host-death family protein